MPPGAASTLHVLASDLSVLGWVSYIRAATPRPETTMWVKTRSSTYNGTPLRSLHKVMIQLRPKIDRSGAEVLDIPSGGEA